VEQSESPETKQEPPPLPRWTILRPERGLEEYGSAEELRREYAERKAVVDEAIAYSEREGHTSD
jgi:hypothetical protein